jgi:hypothetical protein
MPNILGTLVTPFWCDDHKRAFAVPIAGIPIVRRVSVVGQIILASAIESHAISKAEAVARLDRGIRHVGGILNLHVVNCQTGPWSVPLAPSEEENTVGDR